jgi:putative FmdB family regulatory protein
MPTYEYECAKCGHTFEVFQSITEPPKKRCPLCRGKVNRLIGTGAGLLFKGGGFYSTDYRSENYKAASKKEAESTSPAPAKSDAKSDTKNKASSNGASKPKPSSSS